MKDNISEDRIDILSHFIDDLNNENKPSHSNKEDEELEELFETVRAVKRLKLNPVQKEIPEVKKKNFKFSKLKRFSLVGSIVLVLTLISSMLQLPFGQKDDIVHAMVEAYNQLETYSGVIEIRSLTDGKVDYIETIEVKYKKPNKFVAIHHLENDYTVKQISDGIALYTINPNRTTIDYSNPEKELWKYHIGQRIEEIEHANAITKVGEGTVLGRKATIYEYGVPSDNFSHRVWVDETTNLPLRTELILPENRKLINQFTSIDINSIMSDNTFTYTPKQDENVVELNQKATLADAKNYWTISPNNVEDISNELINQGYALNSVVKFNESYWYQYELRFTEKGTENFVDIYLGKDLETSNIYSEKSKVGLLGNGWIEIDEQAVNVFKVYIGESKFIKWVNNQWQMAVVTNTSSKKVTDLLAKTAGDKIDYISYEKLEEMGVKPVITKEGH